MSFYENPVFIDALLVTLYVMLALVLLVVGWSVVHSLQQRGRRQQEWGFPSRWIAWGVGALLAITLTLTALLADTTPLVINGENYDDELWLRIGDMMIYTSGILIVIAAICVAVSSLGLFRGKKMGAGSEKTKG